MLHKFALFTICRCLLADEITVDASIKHQTILGFGGAFTDASGINIATLSRPAQERLLRWHTPFKVVAAATLNEICFYRSYYSKDGLEYGIGRVPIGGTDFSTYPYTYDDDHPGDVTLTYFSLTVEDTDYKVICIRILIFKCNSLFVKHSYRSLTFIGPGI